jgi:hypothetical protein
MKHAVEKLQTDIMGTGKIKDLTVSAAKGETLRVVFHE